MTHIRRDISMVARPLYFQSIRTPNKPLWIAIGAIIITLTYSGCVISDDPVKTSIPPRSSSPITRTVDTRTPFPTVRTAPSSPPYRLEATTQESAPIPLPGEGTEGEIPVVAAKTQTVPTISPESFEEFGQQEIFFGETASLVRQGNLFFNEGNYRPALEKYQEAQSAYGKPSRIIQNWIGNTYLALGEPDQAIRHFTIAIQAVDSRQDRLNRALAYSLQGNCKEAIGDIDAAMSLEAEADEPISSRISAHSIAAGCYIELEDYPKAESHRQSGLRLAEESGYSDETAAQLEEMSAPLQSLMKAEIYPEDLMVGEAYANSIVALELLEAGRYSEGLAILKEVRVEHGRPSSRLELEMGFAYIDLGEHAHATEHFSKAIEIRDDGFTRFARSSGYLAKGDCDGAVRDALISLTMEPYIVPGLHTTAQAHFTVGLCRYELGKYKEALQHLDKGLELALSNGYTAEDTQAYIDLRAQIYRFASAQGSTLPESAEVLPTEQPTEVTTRGAVQETVPAPTMATGAAEQPQFPNLTDYSPFSKRQMATV